MRDCHLPRLHKLLFLGFFLLHNGTILHYEILFCIGVHIQMKWKWTWLLCKLREKYLLCKTTNCPSSSCIAFCNRLPGEEDLHQFLQSHIGPASLTPPQYRLAQHWGNDSYTVNAIMTAGCRKLLRVVMQASALDYPWQDSRVVSDDKTEEYRVAAAFLAHFHFII